jgi:hypothetical protein
MVPGRDYLNFHEVSLCGIRFEWAILNAQARDGL